MATVTAAGPKLTKGEKTRLRILDAALSVIATQGLRAVTHRAVAAEAGVQLSLTTYYFKDRQELIEEAFALFCEGSRPGYQKVWAGVFNYLDHYTPTELRKTTVREKICADLSELATDYLVEQVREKPVRLAVEQVFFTEARLAPRLRAMATEHRNTLLAPLVQMCARFNKQDPELDAELLLDTMTRLEYDALVTETTGIDRDHIARLLRRQIGWALGLRSA